MRVRFISSSQILRKYAITTPLGLDETEGRSGEIKRRRQYSHERKGCIVGKCERQQSSPTPRTQDHRGFSDKQPSFCLGKLREGCDAALRARDAYRHSGTCASLHRHVRAYVRAKLVQSGLNTAARIWLCICVRACVRACVRENVLERDTTSKGASMRVWLL
eukprot:2229839-Pleurochrysis_carterae.AAC.4